MAPVSPAATASFVSPVRLPSPAALQTSSSWNAPCAWTSGGARTPATRWPPFCTRLCAGPRPGTRSPPSPRLRPYPGGTSASLSATAGWTGRACGPRPHSRRSGRRALAGGGRSRHPCRCPVLSTAAQPGHPRSTAQPAPPHSPPTDPGARYTRTEPLAPPGAGLPQQGHCRARRHTLGQLGQQQRAPATAAWPCHLRHRLPPSAACLPPSPSHHFPPLPAATAVGGPCPRSALRRAAPALPR